MSAPNPVVIEFATRGFENAIAAMKSIATVAASLDARTAGSAKDAARSKGRAYADATASMVKGQRDGARAAETAAHAEIRAADSAARARARSASDAGKKQEAAYSSLTKVAARWAREQVAEAKRVADESARAAKQAEKERTRTETQSARVRERADNAEARGKIRTMAATHREEKRQQAATVKEAERAAQAKLASQEKAATAAGRLAARQAKAEKREREQAERKADSRREQYASTIMGSGANAVRSLVRGGTALARTAVNLGGGFSVQDSLNEQQTLERTAVQFSNAAFQDRPGEKRIDKDEIQNQTKATAIKTGTDTNELLAGSAAYGAKSGDYKGGLQLQEFFGKVAKGTGASVSDVASTAGILKVQNKDLGEKEMQSLILNTVRAGQIGSVEFSDLAKVAGNFTRSSAGYEGEQGKTQGKLLGLGQIAMRTAGRDPREAATVITSINADTLKHSDKVGAAVGKDFLSESGKVKDAPEVFLSKIMQATGGNMQKIQGLGYGARSMKMFQALSPDFERGKKDALAKGAKPEAANKAGAAAALAEMKTMTDASMSMPELEKNVGEIMKTSAEQFEGAVRELKMTVGTELVPVLKDLIPIMKAATPPLKDFLTALVSMVKWAQANPVSAIFLGLAGLGVRISASVMAEIAAAKIGDTIKRLLGAAGVGGGGGTPGVPGAGAGKGPNVVGAVAAGAAAGAATYMLARPAVDAVLDGQVTGQRQAGEYAATLKNGTPEEKAQAAKEVARMKERYTGLSGALELYTGVGGAVAGSVYSAVTGEKNVPAEGLSKAVAAREVVSNPEVVSLTAAMQETTVQQAALALALQENTRATLANSTAGRGGGGSDPGVASPYDPSRGPTPPGRRSGLGSERK